ncbi:MAG: gluconolaconase [Acidobacteria bacterium]|jgi:sugar lactone lactonase YvrE|nr:gluconolaconase [Acidobacteriota bacterium]
MNKAGKIVSFNPPYAIPGGEIIIECENFKIDSENDFGCFFNGQAAKLIGASANRVLAIIPNNLETTEVQVHLENGGERSSSKSIIVGRKVAGEMHMVANPAVDPSDNSIILTRSGSRGQQLPATLFRLSADGILEEMTAEVMNPTGIAFNKNQLYVTARADGEVCRITGDEEVLPYASDLGIATGLAFDESGVMFVGDRSGTIYKVFDYGNSETFAVIEPSVSAYHLAFGPDEQLYVTAPGLSSFDAVYKIGKDGFEEIYYRGLGRPQGLAFDTEGNLYVAACIEARHGIVKISNGGEKAEIFVAGMNVVGICFTRNGEMIVATNDSVFSLPLEIYGTLLD